MNVPFKLRCHYFIYSAALSLGLSACGGTGQDAGITSLNQEQTFRGVAVDGHLARALVFIDQDNNATRDPWESFAFTDDQGYYSYNPKTDTDYCAIGASSEQQLYCLRINRSSETAVIRIDGGYDVLTGEPFLGQMSRRVTTAEINPSESLVITPITTLFTNVQNETNRQILLSNLGIEESDLNVDYLDTDGNNTINSSLFNTAVKIHKVVNVLSDRLEDTYSGIGEETGTPNDLSASVYEQLAQQLTQQIQDVHSALESADTLNAVLAGAEQSARAIYQERDLDMPAQVDSSVLTRVTQNASRIAQVIDELLPSAVGLNNHQEASGRARAIESLVIKSVSESGSNDVSIDAATAFFLNTANNNLIDALVSSLSNETADLSTLAQNDFSGDDFDSVEDIVSATQLPQDAQAFRDISGTRLRVSDLDLGYAPNNLNDKEIEVYFLGDEGAYSGALTACVKYIEDANADGTLGEASTRGEVIEGFWSLLNAGQNNGQSYSLLLTIEFLGTTYQAIMKPGSFETIGDVNYQRIRFDYGGDIRSWHTQEGLTPNDASIPSSDSECEDRLPSRIGLD